MRQTADQQITTRAARKRLAPRHKAAFRWRREDHLRGEVTALQNAVIKIGRMAATARAEDAILASLYGLLVARACASASDPEAMYRYIVESLEDSVAQATASDPHSAMSGGVKAITERIRDRASGWLPLTRSRPGEPKIDDRSLVHSARSRSISAILFEVRAGTRRRNVGESALSEIPTLPLAQQGPPHRPAADALTPSTPATSSALPGGCRLPLPGVGCAHDDAKLVGATAASQRQVDQRHVAMSTGHQAREVKPDGVLAGATPGRHV
jgi:hypothetical protein